MGPNLGFWQACLYGVDQIEPGLSLGREKSSPFHGGLTKPEEANVNRSRRRDPPARLGSGRPASQKLPPPSEEDADGARI